MSTKPKKLKTEANTSIMEKRIRAAFQAYDFATDGSHLGVEFEHGQWWVIVPKKTYFVVDAVGGQSIDGFDFEEVG
jgi:hypothetical protein